MPIQTRPEVRYRCDKHADEPTTATLVRYTEDGSETKLGLIKMRNERFYPHAYGPANVVMAATHCYRVQSHAMRHLVEGRPGEHAVDLDRPSSGSPNTPLTQKPPEELRGIAA